MRKITDIKNDLVTWEHKKFINQMDDHWTDANREYDQECFRKITELKAELEEAEKELKG